MHNLHICTKMCNFAANLEKEQNMLTLDLLKQMNLLDYLMHIINSKIKLGTKEIYEVSTCI